MSTCKNIGIIIMHANNNIHLLFTVSTDLNVALNPVFVVWLLDEWK